MTPSSPPPPLSSGRLLSIQTGQVRPLMVGGRKLASAIGKTDIAGPVDAWMPTTDKGAIGFGGIAN